MASISTCFCPRAFAPPNHRSTRKTPSKTPPRSRNANPKPNHPKFKPRPPPRKFRPAPASLSGGEATTYTRLPPREDFFTPSFPTLRSSTEVKLSDSTTVLDKKVLLSDSHQCARDELSSEEEGVDGELGLNYEEFELSEGDSDYEESEDDGGSEELLLDGDGLESGFEGVEEGEDERIKEKGVPAVMRCFDRAKIYVRAGDGGNGVVAFHREKYVPFGGPSGGDGGRGGNVYAEVDGSMNSLLPFRNNIHYRAGRGRHGQGRKQGGAKGEDVVVKVAPGTVIREARDDGVVGEVLLELLHPGQRAMLLPGGRGGRGNASFKSGSNKVPKIAENGEEGPEM